MLTEAVFLKTSLKCVGLRHLPEDAWHSVHTAQHKNLYTVNQIITFKKIL